MENRSIFKVEKKATIVTPSGVQAEIKGLIGKHQALITVQNEKKRAAGLKTILTDCITKLGDKTIITEDMVDKLLSFDRKYFLWEIRKLSNEDNNSFVFDYEFPSQGNKKLKQRYEVDFNEKDFPIKPAKWVKEQMLKDYAEMAGIEVEDIAPLRYKEIIMSENFPVMYDSYEAMLDENLQVDYTLPECKVDIFWKMCTGKEENIFAKQSVETINSHTQLLMRTPKFVNQELSQKSDKEVVQAVPLDQLSNIDIEALRKNIMETEGNVDSMIVVRSDEDANAIAQVDLLQTPAFFFASLAL